MKWRGSLAVVLCLGTGFFVTPSLFAQGTLPPATKSGAGKSGTAAPAAPNAPPRTGASGNGASGSVGPSSTGSALPAGKPAPTATPAAGTQPSPKPGQTAPAMNAQTARDYASYAIGLDMASRFQSDETPINVELLMQGLKDGFSGAKPRFSEAQLRAAAEAFDKEMQLRSQERFQLISERNKKDGAAFLAENKKKKTVKSLPSGLQYEVVKSGTGKSPKMTDKIKAHYHGTLIDGTVFDTTQEDDPVEIEVTSAIAGWTEALPLMKVGDKWRLYVPSELAYGADGFGPVPPNAVLIFDLELLEVAPATAAPANPAAPATLPRPTK
ncbi:MAG: FKBP-type peptidyl-prolyl cis-trans isomerase N-terminal domain-containing protein [Planctomycetota bacterium]